MQSNNWKSENTGSTILIRHNQDESITEREYQDSSDKQLALETQSKDNKPTLQYQERTIQK